MREMSIKEASQALGVCTATIRRRIERGEYTARKEVTEMGERWLIPASQIKAAVKNMDVVSVTRQVSVGELQEALQETIRGTVASAVAQAVESAVAEAVATETAGLKEEVTQLKQQLDGHYKLVDERLRQIMEAKQERRSLWQRLFG